MHMVIKIDFSLTVCYLLWKSVAIVEGSYTAESWLNRGHHCHPESPIWEQTVSLPGQRHHLCQHQLQEQHHQQLWLIWQRWHEIIGDWTDTRTNRVNGVKNLVLFTHCVRGEQNLMIIRK